jgi:hypothetical protein
MLTSAERVRLVRALRDAAQAVQVRRDADALSLVGEAATALQAAAGAAAAPTMPPPAHEASDAVRAPT